MSHDVTGSGEAQLASGWWTNVRHGTNAGWHTRVPLRPMPSGAQRRPESPRRARAQKRLPADVRQQLLDAIYGGQPFRAVPTDLGLTSNQVWGLAKTDPDWSEMLEAASRNRANFRL
jgi:hypothetical protein